VTSTGYFSEPTVELTWALTDPRDIGIAYLESSAGR
jgi:hypothetical protein